MDTDASLLQPGEPPAYERLNSDSQIPLLLTAPHAGGEMPEKLGTMGLSAAEFEKVHARYPFGDIGIADFARELARLTGAFALLSTYHRRVVDLNRPRNERAFKMKGGDLPANVNMTQKDQEARFHAIYDPYHDALKRRIQTHTPKMLFDLHSFHGHIGGKTYDLGFLFHNKAGETLARRLGRYFENRNDALPKSKKLTIGYNAPYDLSDPAVADGSTVQVYEAVPGTSVEIRNDHIDTPENARDWAGLFYDALRDIFPDLLAPELKS